MSESPEETLEKALMLYNIAVVFAIHWHEPAMDLHVFPIPIPPPASLPIFNFHFMGKKIKV